jgi:hypothetical protein
MRYKKYLLVALFQWFCVSFVVGQSIDLSKPLTKQQMYKDFDEFVQIIDSSSQTLVRKIATGYDAAEKIREQRYKIDSIHSHGEFIRFLNECLPLTMAVHTRMATDYRWRSGNAYIDTQIVQPLYENYTQYITNNRSRGSINLGDGFYYKGNYYVYGKHVFVNFNTSDTTILTDFHILKHNDEPISILKNNQIMGGISHWIRWDYYLKQYYKVIGLSIPRSDRVLVENHPTKERIYLDMKNCGRRINPCSLPDSIQSSLPHEESDNMKIAYYDSLRLLYIYMGAMNTGEDFADSIKKVGTGKQIDKIIWDIRGNHGGSDESWIYVLSAIIKNPIPIKGLIGFRNTEAMRKISDDYANHNYTNIVKQKIPYLNNEEFLIMVSGGLTEEGDTVSFAIDTNSLKYDGKIYLLQDEFVFSAAGTLFANAQYIEQLVSVGVPAGLILGRGVSPGIFQLPESKFTFVMEACVDLTDCKTAFDVFHDRPKIEIYPTLEEIIEMNNYGYYLNKRGDEFLFKHDYLFKKVLEME